MTIRHLLTHSSGLRPWRGFHDLLLDKERRTGERLIGTPAAREFVLERVLRSALVHEPGAAAVYGDLDFIVLGAVVEAVARRPLDEFAAERMFGPLGMRDSFFVRTGDGVPGLPEAVRRRVAATENCPWRGRIVWGEVHDPNASVMGGVAGHAGLFSTRGRRDDLRADDPRRLARPQRAAPARAAAGLPDPAAPAPGLRLGARLGHADARRVRPRASTSPSSSVGHLGFTGTSLWIDLEREAIVVMLTNRVHLVAKRSRFELRPVVHDGILEAFAEA